MEDERTFSFALHDQLPTVHHVVSSIMELAPGGRPSEKNETNIRKLVINAYMTKLVDIWSKAFKQENVQCRKTVKKKIHKELEIYYNEVVTSNSRKKPVNKRKRQMEWRKKSLVLFNIKKLTSDPNNFHESEKKFYFDQLDYSSRKMYLSEEIDEEFEKEEEEKRLAQNERLNAIESELSYIYDDVDEVEDVDKSKNEVNDVDLNSTLVTDVSINRSGAVRVKSVNVDDASTQTTNEYFDQPEIRHARKLTDHVKSTCVKVSVKCGISAQKSIVAVQTVTEGMYGHKYYCSKEEALENDPTLAEYRNGAPEKKVKCLGPKSKEHYIPYKNVLPTPKTINDYKQRMAIQEESEAADELYHKPNDVKCTLHYDTTSRCKIDGEWPAIILNFSGKKRFSLRPLFFAYEDRAQIVSLIVETLTRLAILASAKTFIEVTAKELWEQIDVIMTDSVEKNLKIEDGISSKVGSQHIPLHLLCKAHTVEALDRSNLSVLEKIEAKLNFREALISTAPSIKSFLRGEKSVSTAAIKTIINFISHDKSATSTNQASLFDYILEREDKVKHISLYQERRFTKLGYSCASILDAFPYIRMVVNETHLNNQHVEIMRVLMDSEFLLSELNSLAYFTYKVTLPLLNVVESGTQDDLCQIFPQLCQDLKDGSLETLKNYIVEYRHITLNKPVSEVEISLLRQMCYEAAKTIQLQCGREYGIGAYSQLPQRATQIFNLTVDERSSLETSNVICERELGVFDHRSHVAKSRNKRFKAKNLRNDMVLHKSNFDNAVSKLSTAILKQINQQELEWTNEQKELHRKKVEEKMEQARHTSEYTNKLLQKCKSWGGPVTSTEELIHILEDKPDLSDNIVRTELAYYRDTHKADVIGNPKLFKLNKISSEDRLTNFFVLLNGYSNRDQQIPLPNDADALRVLQNIDGEVEVEETVNHVVNVNDICVTLWMLPNGVTTWYLGYCQDIKEDGYVVEHLIRVKSASNLKWKYPMIADIATVNAEQILVSDIVGDWDVNTDRNMTFTLRNHVCINNKFTQLN